jgi:RNA polymerase sigma-70 factor (ECF subfamily)
MGNEDLSWLVEHAKKGDEAAIRELLSRFEDDVRIVVRSRLPKALRSQFDSMDFVQAVWTSVFTKDGPDLTPFDSPQRLRGYLAGVAKNKVVEEHRKRTQTRKYDLKREEPLYVRHGGREVPREVTARGPTPSQDAQADDRLAQILEGCSETVRRVVAFRQQGMSYADIARRMDLHVDAVRRMVETIRRRMEDRGWR